MKAAFEPNFSKVPSSSQYVENEFALLLKIKKFSHFHPIFISRRNILSCISIIKMHYLIGRLCILSFRGHPHMMINVFTKTTKQKVFFYQKIIADKMGKIVSQCVVLSPISIQMRSARKTFISWIARICN